MKFDNFKGCYKLDIRKDVPDRPGLYCLKIKNREAFPKEFLDIIDRKTDMVYIGKASKSLRKRLNQELRAKGRGTFFRSIGAILGYFSPKGSLKNKKNKRNYKFSKEDEQEIIKWIDRNLSLALIETNDMASEKKNIEECKPLVNIIHNKSNISEYIKEKRAHCVAVARGSQSVRI